MAAVKAAPPQAVVSVRAHPPATSIKTGAGNGLGAFGSVIHVESILWHGFTWRIAYDPSARIMWVITEDFSVVDRNMVQLAQLAREIVANKGDVKKTEAAEDATTADRFALRGPKAQALEELTRATANAIACGATTQDIRLAVFSAMGLDSDPAE